MVVVRVMRSHRVWVRIGIRFRIRFSLGSGLGSCLRRDEAQGTERDFDRAAEPGQDPKQYF